MAPITIITEHLTVLDVSLVKFYLPHFTEAELRHSERLSDLPKVTHTICGRSRNWTQLSWVWLEFKLLDLLPLWKEPKGLYIQNRNHTCLSRKKYLSTVNCLAIVHSCKRRLSKKVILLWLIKQYNPVPFSLNTLPTNTLVLRIVET